MTSWKRGNGQISKKDRPHYRKKKNKVHILLHRLLKTLKHNVPADNGEDIFNQEFDIKRCEHQTSETFLFTFVYVITTTHFNVC